MGTEEDARTYFSGNTIRTHDSFHGTQIEYHAPDGRAYLWYPGNKGAVPSLWKTQSSGDGGVQLCYKYPSNSFNPSTQNFGGEWECGAVYVRVRTQRERVVGDPFNLRSGRVPQVSLGGENRPLAWVNDQLRKPTDLRYLDTPTAKAKAN